MVPAISIGSIFGFVLFLPFVNVHATSPTVPDRNLIAHKRCFKCCPCVLDKF